MTLGCLTFFRMFISRVTRSTSALSLILSFSSILIATCSFVIVCVPILTLPNVPCPNDLPKQSHQQKRLTNNVVADGATFVWGSHSCIWLCTLRKSFCVSHSSYSCYYIYYFSFMTYHRTVIDSLKDALSYLLSLLEQLNLSLLC